MSAEWTAAEAAAWQAGYEAGKVVAFTLALNECGDDDGELYERIRAMRGAA